jgi:pullulanase/glycogen debranching enzyme
VVRVHTQYPKNLNCIIQATAEERARMATLAQWLVALAQGIAFFHAGDEVLRSKSLDRDSYDSGKYVPLLLRKCDNTMRP